LIEQGASPLIPKANGLTIYHFAAANNDLLMLDYLMKLNRHFHIDIKNSEGKTPASLASYFGHMDCINLLLENGADLRIADV
jgi:ankyrin repeat protein